MTFCVQNIDIRPVFVSNINDYNLKNLYNELRKQNNIISLEHILEIPKKYNIGKRSLSLLLGWGGQTFIRYCDGDMQLNNIR